MLDREADNSDSLEAVDALHRGRYRQRHGVVYLGTFERPLSEEIGVDVFSDSRTGRRTRAAGSPTVQLDPDLKD